MNGMLALVLLILGLVGLGILRRYLRNRERLRLFEMAHRERMAALEKGLPPAELPVEGNLNAWLDEAWTERALQAGWDRRISLAIGLVVLLGGLGTGLALLLLPAGSAEFNEAREAASFSLIPCMAGLGLLIYYLMTKPPAGT